MGHQRIYAFFLPEEGCPGRCCYCNQNLISGHHRGPTPMEVTTALSDLPATERVAVAFYGGSFTLLDSSRQHDYLAALQPARKRGLLSEIRISTRPDGLGTDQVNLLREGGVDTVEIGAQSLDDEVLAVAGRNYTAAQVKEGINNLRRFGLKCGLQLMPGLPGASTDEPGYSLCQALAWKVDFLRIYPTVVLPGTDLARLYRRGGYRPLGLTSAISLCAELCLLAEAASTPVIRVGLPLEGNPHLLEQVIAGPCHPAFGQLVKSAVWQRLLQPMINATSTELRAGAVDISNLIGHKGTQKGSFNRIAPKLQLKTDSALKPGQVKLDGRLLNRSDLLKVCKGNLTNAA